MSQLCLRFLLSLFPTLAVEMGTALCMRVRGKDLLLVVLVNLLTNPAAVLISVLTGDQIGVQLCLEAAVFLVEGWYYQRYAAEIKRAYLLSFVSNSCSYGAGLLLCMIQRIV